MNRKYTAEMKKQTVIYYLESGKSQEEHLAFPVRARLGINRFYVELLFM